MRSSIVQSFLTGIADAGRDLLLRRGTQVEPVGDVRALCVSLLSQKGEALGTALARELIQAYRELDKPGRQAFFQLLRDEFDVAADEVNLAIASYQEAASAQELLALKRTLKAPRLKLLRAINMAPGGTRAIIDMRADLLRLRRQEPDLEGVDADFTELLEAWFNRGFLRLEQIDWQTPAHILEKLIAYESVHAIQGWDDLRRRLQDDRRCFAFFHPALPDEPLIFVEVALIKGLADAINPLLDHRVEPIDPRMTDTAIFYSINNCQYGLRGISFGSFLIKQVVTELEREFPNIKQFATLSPIPGFRDWLASVREPEQLSAVGLPQEQQTQLIALDQDDWWQDEELAEVLRKPVMHLCAYYLLFAQHDKRPLDPVARFHLGNGAILQRINWLGDTSAKGLRESAGLLVNYVYDLKKIVENHEAFINEGRIVSSKAVRRHLLSR